MPGPVPDVMAGNLNPNPKWPFWISTPHFVQAAAEPAPEVIGIRILASAGVGT